jgi:hypothetical protein
MHAARGRRKDPDEVYELVDSRCLPVVEMRVIRALKTLQSIPDPDSRFLRTFHGRGSSWPETVLEAQDCYGYAEAKLSPLEQFRPTPRDISDMLTALSWLNILTKQERQLIKWRSDGYSFKQMADNIHRSAEAARKRYNSAMQRVWRAATSELL